MKADGSGRKTFGPDWVGEISRISPDGTRVAFVAQKDHPGLYPEFNRSELYVMGIDGSQPLRLTHNEVNDGTPSWTPDGNILFCMDVSGYCQV